MRHRWRIAILGLVLLAVPRPLGAAADGSWIDGPRANWNRPGLAIPVAPPMDPNVNPRCLALGRAPETAEDAALVAAGWTLFGRYQAGWGIVAIKALSGYDGMCRPMGFQEFVFVDGALAGTISPELMDSRTDGAGQIGDIPIKDRLVAAYARYRPEDPLCCPSGSATVSFTIDRGGPAPVLAPLAP